MTHRPITPYATEVIGAEGYLSEEWHERRRSTVSASEIAVILGISPYRSPFDLWWSKHDGDEQPENEAMRRGRRLEPLVLEDFQSEHPEFHVAPVGMCVSNDRPWQACTPDALAYDDVCRCGSPDSSCVCLVGDEEEPVAVVEAKTQPSADGWGERHTDDIPPHYRAQVLWQMDVLGLSVAYLPVWIGFSYREYVVEYDAADVALMRKAAEEFLNSLVRDQPPPIDAHAATTRRLKQLHPSLIDGEVEVPAAWVAKYHDAKLRREAAQGVMDMAENHIRAAMGDYHVATVDGVKVASRSVTDIPERTQTVHAHTRNVLHFTKAKESA